MFEILLDPQHLPFWILILGIIAVAIAVISRPFSTYARFVYPNAKFEAIGNPFLHDKNLDPLMESKGLSSFIEHLNSMKDYNLEGETPAAIQHSLDTHYLSMLSMMKRDSSKAMASFYEVYLKIQDMMVIKNSVFSLLYHKELPDHIDQALLPLTQELLQKLKEAEEQQLPEILREYGFPQELLDLIDKKEVDVSLLDAQFDRYSMSLLNAVHVPYKCEKGKQAFIKTYLDLLNMKHLLRAKQLHIDKDSIQRYYLGEGREIPPWKFTELAQVEAIPQIIAGLEGTSYYETLTKAMDAYNKEQSTQSLETALDRLLLHKIAEISSQYYVTIGPTLRFLISKQFEIRNLKIIAKAVSEGLSPPQMKPLLVTEGTL